MASIIELEKAEAVLLVIDIQGKLARLVSDSEQFTINCTKLIKGMQLLNIPIILTEHVPDKLGPTVPEINALLTQTPPVLKNSFSCFLNHDFARILKESDKKTVIICGIETHICVYQTARDLMLQGYRVIVVADATSSRSIPNKEIALELMKEAGASIMNVEMVLFDLLKVAVGDEFRQISKLLK